MKTRAILIAVMLIFILSIASCNENTGDVFEDISCEQFNANNHYTADIRLETGDKFRVKLCSNPSTGFQWQYETNGDDILKEEYHNYIEPDGDVPGAAGSEIWTFEVVRGGVVEISMHYSQPWEGGVKDKWTYIMIVLVR